MTHLNQAQSNAWYQKTWLVVILCIFLFPVGLYALWKNSGIAKGWKITWTVIIAFVVIANFGSNSDSTNASVAEATTNDPQQFVRKGEVLKTDYFDVTLHEVEIAYKVNTGNEFTDLKPESGIAYLLLRVTFLNTDTESRMIDEGAVYINFNGKEYEFDKSEVVMAEGWGLLLDQINPLTSKSTILVYKIPSNISGKAYYEPGRNSDDQRILIGDIDFAKGNP